MTFDEELCLYSHEFESTIRATWQKLQVENDFYDVTLACGGKQIEAHKIILSSSSSVLKSILKKKNLNRHPIIYLWGVKYEDLKKMVEFIHQGEVSIAHAELASFLALAKELKIKGLDEEISQMPLNKNDNLSSPRMILPEKNDELHNVGELNKTALTENNDVKTEPTIKIKKDQEDNIDYDSNNEIVKHSNEETKPINYDNVIKRQASLLFKKLGVWPCSKCDKQFGSYSGLYCHDSRIHCQISYSCNQCDYKSTKKFGVKEHIQNIHEGIRYPCEYCGQKSTTKGSLKAHIKSMHEEPSRACDKCDYITTTKINMKLHVEKIHDKIRYSCEQCDYSAADKNSLTLHVKAIHEGIRYPCDQCDHYATRKGSLRMHKNALHSDKLYPCDKCDHIARSWNNHVKHKKTHYVKN